MRKQVVFFGLFLALFAPIWGQMKLAVLEPDGKGLSKDELWMLSLVQSSIAGDIDKYSAGAIAIIDRQNLEAIIAEQKRSLSAITSDEDAIQIGNLANASHILTGKITKTPNAFMLELAITDAETGVRNASLSPKSVTLSQMEDLSALKEASADLLKQLGVSLTDEQLAELRGPAASAQVQAQTALAHGVVAQRQGTSVAALSYFYQAASFDPTLVEAVSRSSVVSADISGINLGENIRNDIVWRKKWVEQLKETEETFYKIINSASPPYTLYYSTAIETKNINYQTETADLSIPIHLLANEEWFTALQRSLRAAQAVMDGLDATGRKKDWGLNGWPEDGVSNTNPFGDSHSAAKAAAKAKARAALQAVVSSTSPFSVDCGRNDDISVKFELVNQQGRVIGSQTLRLSPSFNIYHRDRFVIDFTENTRKNTSNTLTFKAVKADDISDNLTIRLASVNGASPETAKFQITAISDKESPQNPVKRMTFTDSRDGKKYQAVEIGIQTWMAENLNYNASGSQCYDNKESNCQKYGRLYNWNTAKTACPKGWHLPSVAEWNKLKHASNEISKVGKHLKAKNGWNKNGNGEDKFGFSALPGGDGHSGNFYNVGTTGFWWSASAAHANYAYYLRIYEYVDMPFDDRDYLYSVRCLMD